MSANLTDAVILVVEDNSDNLFIALESLRRVGAGYCNGCASGPQLFNLIAKLGQPVDLILLDLQIPIENGYVILDRIRATPQLRYTRVVALTATVMPDDLAQARAAGFDGLIGKPISQRRFAQQIARALTGEVVWEPR
jgi:two-component system, cell cycle response regulator DivK